MSSMRRQLTGLILTGGGARAAYQVGVLSAISEIRRDLGLRHAPNPFPIVCGTSAGAINGTALACSADDFDLAVERLVQVWRNFHAEQVYEADSLGVIRSGAKWLTMLSLGWLLTRWRKARPKSLLDNAPLEQLLKRLVPLDRVPALMAQGHLHALAVSGSSYTSGQHVTFYECAANVLPWNRSQRIAVRDHITHQHLLASSAIPFVFPARELMLAGQQEYFGDGSMRQAAPVSPAIHLGADKVLVVGAGRLQETGHRQVAHQQDYPSLAQIAGHTLSNIFLDALAVDIERLQRVNHTLRLLPEEARRHTPLRPVELLVIAPTQRLDDVAAKHIGALPGPIRTMLAALGVKASAQSTSGAALASYLLFEADYTRELIDMGRSDTFARRGEVEAFFGWGQQAVAVRGAA